MIDLPRISSGQQAVVRTWLPEAELVADLSWNLVDTTVLHLRTPDGDRIVKAGGPTNHHIDREIHAHQHFTAPWVARGRAARMLRHDGDMKIMLLDYLPGSLMEGTAAANDPTLYRQAGALLAELHRLDARPDEDYEAKLTRKSLAWLEAEHRIPSATVRRLRDILLAHEPRPVTLVPTHGDWQPRNWLVDGDTLLAIDFGRADWRPAFSDFARLAVREFRTNPALEAAFLDGYGSDPRTPDLWYILQVREAIGTAIWAYRVGDEPFEMQGHRMIDEVLGSSALGFRS
ncbi:MAG: aminoglycoside phosphotransferase family protein [Thermomicrobiales bacterium]|nr:aminoglycoside phosphotransferase family protein [Thermomicrobiales bacterium]